MEEEDEPLPDFMIEMEDDLFSDFGNTSNYYCIKRLQNRNSSFEDDPSESSFLKGNTKNLVSDLSRKWLEESELSSDVIRLDSPSTTFTAKYTKILLKLFIIQLWVLISCLHFLLMICYGNCH